VNLGREPLEDLEVAYHALIARADTPWAVSAVGRSALGLLLGGHAKVDARNIEGRQQATFNRLVTRTPQRRKFSRAR
jgi:hypothetical protein